LHKKTGQSFLNGAIILGAGTMAVKLIGVFFKIPLERMLNGIGYSYFSTAYDLFTPIYALSVSGFPVAVSKLVSENLALGRYRDVRRIRRISMLMFMLIGVIGSLAMFFGAGIFVKSVNNPSAYLAVAVMSPALFFGCMSAAFRGYYQGFQDMKPTAVSQITEAFAKLAAGLSLCYLAGRWGLSVYEKTGAVFGTAAATLEEAQLAVLPYSAAGAVAGVTLSTLAGFAYISIRYHVKGDSLTKQELLSSPVPMRKRAIGKKIIAIAVPVCLSTLVANITTIIDLTSLMNRMAAAVKQNLDAILRMYDGLIPVLQSPSEIPAYLYGAYTGMAIPLYNLVPTITTTIGVSILPAVSAAWAENNRPLVNKNIETVLRLTSMIAIPAGLSLAVLAKPILFLLYSSAERIAIVAPMLRLLGIAVIFVALTTPSNSMLNAIGRVDIPVKIMLIGSALKLAVNYTVVSIPHINIQGAPFGTILCYLFIAVSSIITLCKITQVKISFYQTFLKPFLCAAVCAGTAYASFGFISRMIAKPFSKTATVLSIIIAGSVYAISLMLSNTIKKSDILMLPNGEKIVKILEKLSVLR